MIVYSIHFCCRDRGVSGNKLQIVGKLVAIIINRLFTLLKFFSCAHGYLPAKREVIYVKIFENTALNVGIERFHGEVKFGMVCKDLIKRLAFEQERSNRLSNQDAFRFRKVDALSGIGEMEKVSLVSLDSVVEVMIEPTMVDLVTMVAGTDRAVSKGTVLFNIGRTILRAVSE